MIDAPHLTGERRFMCRRDNWRFIPLIVQLVLFLVYFEGEGKEQRGKERGGEIRGAQEYSREVKSRGRGGRTGGERIKL